MKKAFTLIEVIILLVIFTLVALLVIPLSVDDTIQAKYVSKWKQVQGGFIDIPLSVKSFSDSDMNLQDFVAALVKVHPLNNVVSYKIKYMNGDIPKSEFVFSEIYNTDNGATLAFEWFATAQTDTHTGKKILGILMYDVNGKKAPNIWGKDVFGMNIYKDSIEPFGQSLSIEETQYDCSRVGTGRYCSSYYLRGGAF